MSTSDIRSTTKMMSTTHIIEANIEDVYEMLSDWTITDHLFLDIFSETIMIRGKNTSEIGCFFKKSWSGALLEGECLENKSYDNEKRLRWVLTVQNSVKFDFCYNLIKHSTDDTTILFWETSFTNRELVKEAWQKETTLREETVNRWNKFLKKRSKVSSQVESLMISQSLENIWEEIVNWHLFAEIGKIIEWDGPVAKEGSVMIVQMIQNNSKFRFKVIKSNNITGENTWEYELGLYGEFSKVPSQVIKFKILKLADKNSFLVFEHIFHQSVNKEDLKALIKEKREVLNCFKLNQTKKSKSF